MLDLDSLWRSRRSRVVSEKLRVWRMPMKKPLTAVTNMMANTISAVCWCVLRYFSTSRAFIYFGGAFWIEIAHFL